MYYTVLRAESRINSEVNGRLVASGADAKRERQEDARLGGARGARSLVYNSAEYQVLGYLD